MLRSVSVRPVARPGLAAGLLGALVVLAVLTGGASFPDTLGQTFVRTGAMLLLAIGIGAGLKFDLAGYRGIVLILLTAVSIVVVQLVPLPPAVWRALPGRSTFDLTTALPEVASTWRPAAIVPDAAWNALFSLTVPLCALLLLTAIPRPQLALMVPLLVAIVGLSSVVAALQFAGTGINNPMINDIPGFASGLLANRNHQALFLAIGIVATLQWGSTLPFLQRRAVASGIITAWFVLMILATGSRAGLMLGLVALAGGCMLIFGAVRRVGVRVPRRTKLLIGVLVALALAGIIAASLYSGRSESINRLNEAHVGEDARLQALPVVLDMVKTYMPVGAGQGGFATLFSAIEPDALLKLTYFNRAHNDFLELLIEAGLPGALLLLCALAWFGQCAWWAWRTAPDGETQRARLGTIVIFLALMASVVDYPARTPLIMVVLVLAAGWFGHNRAQLSGFTQ